MAFLQASGDDKFFFIDRYIGSQEHLKEWVYVTVDTYATVTGAGYFSSITGPLPVKGDIIRVYQCTSRNDLSTVQNAFALYVADWASSIYTLLWNSGTVLSSIGAPYTDNAVLRFDGTSGKAIQGSSVTVSDAGAIGSVGSLDFAAGGSLDQMTGSATDNAIVRQDGATGKKLQSSTATLSDAGALGAITQVGFTNTTVIDGLTPGFIANASGGLWGSRKHIIGGSARLAPLQLSLDVPAGEQHKYVLNINRTDGGDNSGTAGQLTLDYGILIEATRTALNHTRVHGLHMDIDDFSTFAAPSQAMCGIDIVSTVKSGSKGNLIGGVFTYLDQDGSTSFSGVEMSATMPHNATYSSSTIQHMIAATANTATLKGTIQSFIWMHTSPDNGNNTGADVNKALRFTEESSGLQGRINYILHATTSPGAGVGALAYHTGTMGRGLWFEGTYDLAVFDVPGLLTLSSSMKLGTNAAYDIYHNDDDRLLTVAGGNAAGAGGNVVLYGNAHATKASTVELKSASTIVATVLSTGVNLANGKVLQVNATTVVKAQQGGWSVDTGTAKRTANATYTGTAEATYTQATIQTLMDKVRDLSQTIKALKDDLHATAGHGLIGP